jgi:hypothetical protein
MFGFLDQFFSRVAVYLRCHAAHSRDAILNAVKISYNAWWAKDPTVTQNLETAANFSSFIGPYVTAFSGIMKPLQFEIFKKDNVTVVRTRKRCGSHTEPWRGLRARDEDSTPVCFFVYVCSLLNCVRNVACRFSEFNLLKLLIWRPQMAFNELKHMAST